MRNVLVVMWWPSQAVRVLLFWSSTAAASVFDVDGLEGGVTDGWPELELELSHWSIGATAAQREGHVQGAGGVEGRTSVVPPSASYYRCTVT